MYQYSLVYIKGLFNKAIEMSQKKKDLQERLNILIDNITRTIYTNVSRGLFEAHKIIFSFLIITSINRNSGKVKELHWNILLRGPGPVSADELRARPKNPELKILTAIGWDLLYFMDLNDKETYGGLCQSMAQHWHDWHDWAVSPAP